MASQPPNKTELSTSEKKKQMYELTTNKKFLRSVPNNQNNNVDKDALSTIANFFLDSDNKVPKIRLKPKSITSSNEKPKILYEKYEQDLNLKYNTSKLPYSIIPDGSTFTSTVAYPLNLKMKYSKIIDFERYMSRYVLVKNDNEDDGFTMKIISKVDVESHLIYLNDYEDMNDTHVKIINYDKENDSIYLLEYVFHYPGEEALCVIVSDLFNRKSLIKRDDQGKTIYSSFIIREEFIFSKSNFFNESTSSSLEDISNTYTSISLEIISKGYMINNTFLSFLYALEYQPIDQKLLKNYVLYECLINSTQLALILTYNKNLQILLVRYYSTNQLEWIKLPIKNSISINIIQGSVVLASVNPYKSSYWSLLRFDNTNLISIYDNQSDETSIIISKTNSSLFQSFECSKCMYTIGNHDSRICYTCLKVVHINCLESDYKKLLIKDFYFCDKCLPCFNCKTDSSHELKYKCTSCSKAYHFHCIYEAFKTTYSKFDVKTFKCENCIQCSQCHCTSYDIISPNKFTQACDMCEDCEKRRLKKEYCLVCNQIWNSQRQQLIECKCKFFIHRECDRILTEDYYSSIVQKKKYLCPICRIKKKNKQLNNILKEFSELHVDINQFYSPVDTKNIPNYLKVIKSPMCFEKIEERLKDNLYLRDMNMFFNDVNLIFDNAMIFNKPNDYIHKLASSLKVDCNKILNDSYSFLYQMSFEYYLFEYYQNDLTLEQLNELLKERFPGEIIDKMNIDHAKSKINEYDIKWMWLTEYGFEITFDTKDIIMHEHKGNSRLQSKLNDEQKIGGNSLMGLLPNNTNGNNNGPKYKSFKANEIQLELDLHNSNFEAPRKSSRTVHYAMNSNNLINTKMEINENGFDMGMLPLKEEEEQIMKDYEHARLTEKKLCFLYPGKFKDYSIKCNERSSYLDFISSFLSHKEDKKKNNNGSPKNSKKTKYIEKEVYDDEIPSFSDSSYEKKTKKEAKNKKRNTNDDYNNIVHKGKGKSNKIIIPKDKESSIVNNNEDNQSIISNSTQGNTSMKDYPIYKDKHSPCLPCQVCFSSIDLGFEKNCFLCGSFEDQDSFATCSMCYEHYHSYCISSTIKDVKALQMYSWKCQNCKVCSKCELNNNLSKMLYCDCCDKASHIYCLNQILTSIPQSCFKCESCFECLHCQSKSYYSPSFPLKKDKDYLFFTRNYDYCFECGMKNFYASLCAKCKISDYKNYDKKLAFISTKEDYLKQYNLNDYFSEEKAKDIIMIYCNKCRNWYHSKCIGFDLMGLSEYFQRYDRFECLDCHLRTNYPDRYNDISYVSYLEVLKLSFKLLCFTKITIALLKNYQQDASMKLHSKLTKIFLKDSYAKLLQNKNICMFIELMKMDVYILRDKNHKKKIKKSEKTTLIVLNNPLAKEEESVIPSINIAASHDENEKKGNNEMMIDNNEEKEPIKPNSIESKKDEKIMEEEMEILLNQIEQQKIATMIPKVKHRIKNITKALQDAKIRQVRVKIKKNNDNIPIFFNTKKPIKNKTHEQTVLKHCNIYNGLIYKYFLNKQSKFGQNKMNSSNKMMNESNLQFSKTSNEMLFPSNEGMNCSYSEITDNVPAPIANNIKIFNDIGFNDKSYEQSKDDQNKQPSLYSSIEPEAEENGNVSNNIHNTTEQNTISHVNQVIISKRKRLLYKNERQFNQEIESFFNNKNNLSYYNGPMPDNITDFYSFDLDKYNEDITQVSNSQNFLNEIINNNNDLPIDNNSGINNQQNILNDVMKTCLSFIKAKTYSSSINKFILTIIINAIVAFRDILLQWLINQLTSTENDIYKETISEDPSEQEITKFLDLTDPMEPSPNKNQECEFCKRKGGRAKSGRLIHLKHDIWGHINCIYWSKGVTIEANGLLSNVYSVLNKSSQLKCLLCKKSGATVMCRVPKCGRPFHFICAIAKGCTFTKDNEVYCNRCPHAQKDDSNLSQMTTKHLYMIDKKYDYKNDYKYQVGFYNKFGTSTILKFIQINSNSLSYENVDIGIVKYVNEHILLFTFNDSGILLANLSFNNSKEFEEYALKSHLLNCLIKTEVNYDELTSSDIIRYTPKNELVLNLNYCPNKQDRTDSITSLFTLINSNLNDFLSKAIYDGDNQFKHKEYDDVLKLFNFYFEFNRLFSTHTDSYLKRYIDMDNSRLLKSNINNVETFETKQKKNLKNRLDQFVTLIKTKNKTMNIDDNNIKLQYSICFKFDNYIEKHQQFLKGRRNTGDIEMKDYTIAQDETNDASAINRKGIKLQKQSYKNLNKTMSTNLMEADIPLAMKYRNYKALRPKVSIGPSRIHRNGLFATDNFQPGEIVIEYVGEFITNKVADYREKEYNLRGFGDCYMFRVDAHKIIDATKFGNLARFINHSCDPNCSAQSNEINNKKHIILYAKKLIKNGEEITYDYNFESETEKIQCRCGAINCQGRLN